MRRSLINARTLANRSEQRFDVAIVGGGPAGIVIAERLAASGLSVGLLEGGGALPGARAQRLMRGDIEPGGGYAALDASRIRALGGSSVVWGGWCVPLRSSDFTPRSWVPHSGWPISFDDFRSFHPAAAEVLRLASDRFDSEAWQGLLGAAPPLPHFEPLALQVSPVQNFAMRPGALTEPGLTTIVGMNVTEIQLDAGGTAVRGLVAQTLGGKRLQIQAERFVLAAGAIENARLMLASRGVKAEGVGNSHDMVGRFFMDHVHGPIAYIETSGESIDRFFSEVTVGESNPHDPRSDHRVRGFLNPTPDSLQADQLPDCSISLSTFSHQFHGWPMMHWPGSLTASMLAIYESIPHLTHGMLPRGFARQGWRAMMLVRKLGRELPIHARQSADLRCLSIRAEQYPEPDRRVRLSERHDALGMPTVELDWEVSSADRSAMLDRLETVRRAFEDTGLGQVLEPISGWEDMLVGGPHHLGTTRMSEGPETGVVDRDCRVHGVENLFVAGSSVFATGGWANPTFSVIALALRLAAHLVDEPAAAVSVPSHAAAVAPGLGVN